jgi:cobalamin biosynthesis Mg chelatase CobN
VAADAAAPAAEERGKTGARKVAVPGPEVSSAGSSSAADDPAATRSGYDSGPAAEAPKRPSTAVPVTKPVPAPAPAAAAGATDRVRTPKRETPIWTYVGVGVTFGLVLIGIYQLVGYLAH